MSASQSPLYADESTKQCRLRKYFVRDEIFDERRETQAGYAYSYVPRTGDKAAAI